MGYGVVLLMLPNHLAAGVKGGEGVYGTYWDYEGSKYYYLETTGENWQIGELPEAYKGTTAQILDMKPIPILTHNWTATRTLSVVDLEVIVQNLGSATAQDVYVSAGFDAGDNQVWNKQQSPLFQLGMNEKITANLSLRIPYGKHTRLIIQIIYGGYAVDESYSEWFDT